MEKRLRDLAAADAELERRQQLRPRALSQEEKNRMRALGSDLRNVWTAPTTTDRDRKELLRTLLEEVIVTVDRPAHQAHLTVRWRGGKLREIDLPLPPPSHAAVAQMKTPSRCCVVWRRSIPTRSSPHPESPRRETASGERFTAFMSKFAHYRGIPALQPSVQPTQGGGRINLQGRPDLA